MGLSRGSSNRSEHQYVEERLSAYLDGVLPPGERQNVETHLAACPRCQWSFETLRETVQWTRELPTVSLPRVFTIPVPVQPEPVVRRGWGLPVLQAATALVALLFFFAVAGDFVLTGLLPSSAPQEEPVYEMAPSQSWVEEQQLAQPTMVVQATPLPATEPVQVEEALEVAKEAELPPAEPPMAAAPAELPVMEAESPALLPTGPAGALGVQAAESADDSPRKMMVEGESELGAAGAASGVAADAAAPPAQPEPTASAVPTPPPLAPTMTMVPLAHQVSEPAAAPRQEVPTGGALRGALGSWLGAAQLALGFLFVVLGLITIVLTVRHLAAR